MADVQTTASSSDESEVALEEKGGQRNSAEVVDRWLKELQAAETHERDWRKRADKIVKLYRDEREKDTGEGSTTRRFNILYANTEVLKGALYSQCPVPDVRRRFLDKNPVSRMAALVLNRALITALDRTKDGEDFDAMMRDAVFDMVVPGRAVARVKYVPTIQAVDGVDEVIYECTEAQYVEWSMFRYSPAKRWSKVRWVAFADLLTRDDLVKQFGEQIGNAVEMKWLPKGVEDSADNDIFKRALVWTIWNKTQKKCLVVTDGYKDAPLQEVDDPLHLEDFFPMPRPLYDIPTTDSLIPTPEYAIYQDHALQLDAIEERISILTDALRRRGVYDASIPELEGLAGSVDNKFVPVKEYAKFTEKGGLEQAFQELPIDGLAKVLLELMKQAEAKKQQIYEIIGISDIMRGSTEASETATAQERKSQWGETRIGTRQFEVQRFARDMLRLQAEIIAEHFSAKTLAQMTGISMFFTVAEKQQAVQVASMMQQQQQQAPQDERMQRPTWEEVLQVLRSDKLRGFNVDIETDSTIRPQADQEQKNRIEALSGITTFLEKALPAVQTGAVPKKLVDELLMFGIRAFPVGPQLEEILDQWSGSGLDEQQGAMPSPELIQLKAENAQLKAQADEVNAKREESNGKLDVERQAAADRAGIAKYEAEEKARLARDVAFREMDLREQKQNHDAEHERMRTAGQAVTDMGKAGASGKHDADMAKTHEVMAQAMQIMAQAAQMMGAEKEIVRDAAGRPVGVRPKAMH